MKKLSVKHVKALVRLLILVELHKNQVTNSEIEKSIELDVVLVKEIVSILRDMVYKPSLEFKSIG